MRNIFRTNKTNAKYFSRQYEIYDKGANTGTNSSFRHQRQGVL